MQFLYHARPRDMRGDVLYPLNMLQSKHLDLYEDEKGKYAGREELLELRIPILEVLWNDALHLSPIHPSRLAAAWDDVGLSSPAWEREFFEIPVGRVEGLECVWFASGALPIEVTRFDPDAYEELAQPPASYREYLRRCKERDHPPRPFGHVPHVLVAAPVDVAGLPLVTADERR